MSLQGLCDRPCDGAISGLAINIKLCVCSATPPGPITPPDGGAAPLEPAPLLCLCGAIGGGRGPPLDLLLHSSSSHTHLLFYRAPFLSPLTLLPLPVELSHGAHCPRNGAISIDPDPCALAKHSSNPSSRMLLRDGALRDTLTSDKSLDCPERRSLVVRDSILHRKVYLCLLEPLALRGQYRSWYRPYCRPWNANNHVSTTSCKSENIVISGLQSVVPSSV